MVANSDDKPTKNPKRAVALKYKQGTEGAPTVVAKGRERMAEKILELAREHDLHIHEDADLVEVLEKVELDQEIPLEVYSVVAEIFSYIYEANKKRANGTNTD